ncbi:(E,E)-geranyllinalool synthase-like [Rhododendron vialii]|uniref:(E,E)-geranyllinalool synthase-like n=1 Tax=Rhododendron vialii TaxID=182163 RepID=UPI00265E98F5|nr:(E,E)-geranyllinalool synthase-like [Rhododendron vialii]
MESSLSRIQALVTQIKQEIFLSPFDPLSFVSPSAYETTAWLAMVPDHPKQGTSFPMFKGCLEWIVNNQREEGFWGEDGIPTIDGLPSTLACLVALKTWGAVGEENIEKVPTTYPVDGELMRLCLVNHIQRLGLAEHFTKEIDEILERIYRSYKNQESREIDLHLAPEKIYKDSLAFRLLRMQGYSVTPRSFCWFLYDEDIRVHVERNFEYFIGALYNVYRATEHMFSREYEAEEAKLFSKKLLEKSLKLKSVKDDLNFQRVIEHELRHPWIARLDHLDHRMWIEQNKIDTLWIEKASFDRLSCLHNDKLMQLAVENYNYRQSIYRKELEELTRWSKEWRLSEMGFGREKTAYCYFAIASSTCLPLDSTVRILVAKSSILVTVADDLYDMEGSLDDLNALTQAVQRWDGKGLSGHGDIIFRGLEDIVSEIAENHVQQYGIDITENLRHLWGETFGSWMMETTWSKTGYLPSLDEYLQTGMTSIATHTMIMPALCFLNYDLKSDHYQSITKLLMASSRLLNDIQSYQKELEVGKKNFVILHSKANPKAGPETSIKHVKEILDEMKKELLEQALMDGFNDLPKTCNHFHLSILRVFYMFFNSSNLFDSATELLHDINRAIHVPIPIPIK